MADCCYNCGLMLRGAVDRNKDVLCDVCVQYYLMKGEAFPKPLKKVKDKKEKL